jgi:hypothetical protein
MDKNGDRRVINKIGGRRTISEGERKELEEGKQALVSGWEEDRAFWLTTC